MDTETYAFEPGLVVPPIVLGSAAWWENGHITGKLLTKAAVLDLFQQIAEDDTLILIGANIAFDLLAWAKAAAKLGVDVYPLIYRMLTAERVFDVLHAQALKAVADGTLGKDPSTGGPLRDPITGKQGRYSLSIVTSINLGRKDAKAKDAFKLRYGEFDGMPLEELPIEAAQYPVDDSCNTHENALGQAGFVPKVRHFHRWVNIDRKPSALDVGQQAAYCGDCGSTKVSDPCRIVEPHENLHDLSNQVGAAFALAAGAARGFRVDQRAVDVIERFAQRSQTKGLPPFISAGLIREDGTENRAVLKRKIAIAYGATKTCPTCAGTGKVISPRAPFVRCSECLGKSALDKLGPAADKWRIEHPMGCTMCGSVGKVRNQKALINCASPEGEKTCDGTGLVVDGVPVSEGGGVSYGRDTLHESGDEMLMAFADFGEDAKDLDVYIPYLRRARVPVGRDALGNPTSWRDIPLTLKPNAILESGRVSYSDVIQQFKRKPGHRDKPTGVWVPSLRECLVARPGYVFSSEDYEAGELITHAQSCIWLAGFSKMAEALIKGIKVHSQLGASMIGVDYAEFRAREDRKDRGAANARQAAKPGNFGFPGLMGPPKMVLQQRKQGPDTPCERGPAMITLENGDIVPGYKGLRFCVLMDGAETCGEDVIRSWGSRSHAYPIAPICARCADCAAHLRKTWLQQWPENVAYFKHVKDAMEYGVVVTAEMLERWPHLAEVFRVGQRTRPAQIIQHVSGRLRGGIETPSACANTYFQALLADAAKAALRRVSQECYDRTARVDLMAHANSHPSAYARAQSPLYGSHVIPFFHDEIFLEHPEVMAHDASFRVAEIMVDELRWYCPDLAPACNVDPTLMRRWYKNAKQTWKLGGSKRKGPEDRMIPWELPRAA